MAKLTFVEGPLQGQEFELPVTGTTIGRSRRCDITLDDGKVSGEHALLRLDSGLWWVYDLQSSNGTRVNDGETPAAHLKEGDRVCVGDSVCVFSSDGESEEKGGGAPQAEPAPLVVHMEGDDIQIVKDLNDAYNRMQEQLGRMIVGQKAVIEQVLISIFCRGHALLVGVPGVAKTLLVSTLSHVLDMSFKRVQFTPDLMPSDITGTDVLEEDHTTGKRYFRFVQGPIFANMVLADEINRTPPKTQAALLEAMQEHRVTVGEQTYRLPEPFFVLATQNPIEQEGTYPLPEAQLDRFMFNIIVDYPKLDEEHDIIRQVTGAHQPEIEVALTTEEVLRLQQIVRRVPVADHVINYARDLARATRPKDESAPDFVKEMVAWGAGPRAGIYLVTAAKARAILRGRFHATTEDVKAVSLPVLRHRVLTTFNAEAAGVSSDEIVRLLLEHVQPLPAVDV
jgi:MoxR-like ATPase